MLSPDLCGKLILVVILVSILLSFVLAPLVDLLVRLPDFPRAAGRAVAVVLLVSALGLASYVSYSRALDFMHEVPKYKARIQAMGAKIREQAQQINRPQRRCCPKTIRIRGRDR